MPHHQYRFIGYSNKDSDVWKFAEAHFPSLLQFMGSGPESCGYGNSMYGISLFIHELAHCIEMFHNGEKHRLKVNNFGWAIGTSVGKFSPVAATRECRVLAFQALIVRDTNADMDLLNNLPGLVQNMRYWVDGPDALKEWLRGGTAPSRIEANIETYLPIWKDVVGGTLQYLADECNEFMRG